MSLEDVPKARRVVGRIHGLAGVSRWTIWTQRPGLIAYCLVVEATALIATVITAVVLPIHPGHLVLLAWLVVLGVGQAEWGRRIERLRRQVSDSPHTTHINVTSVWTFAGVWVLPPALVTVLVAALYLHLQLRTWYRLNRTPPFRTVFNACLAIITCHAVMAVLTWGGVTGIGSALDRGWSGLGGIVLSGGTYFGVAMVIALPGLSPSGRPFYKRLGGWIDNALEIVTLCLGVLTALALTAEPLLAVLVVPPVLLAHWFVLVMQLQAATAAKDPTTGLFNHDSWHELATNVLRGPRRTDTPGVAVLMIDIHNFQRIRHRYGQPASDDVQTAVGNTIVAQTRTFDAVGRFNDGEFAVLLPGITKANALRVADQVRHAIADLEIEIMVDGQLTTITDLSASIGVALAPSAGATISKLTSNANTGKLVADITGSNKVVCLPDTA